MNGEVLVTGGGGDATAEIYNPTTGGFTYTTGNMTTAVSNQTSTLPNHGTVLVAGGTGSSGASTATAELYSPTSGTFSATGSLNSPRDTQTATLLGNGNVLITTGENAGTYLSTTEFYNPTTAAFTVTGSLANPRLDATANLLNSGEVLIAGGWAQSQLPVAPAELYNPTTATLSRRQYEHPAWHGRLGTSQQWSGFNRGRRESIPGFLRRLHRRICSSSRDLPARGHGHSACLAADHASHSEHPGWRDANLHGLRQQWKFPTGRDLDGSNPSLASVTTNANGTGTVTGIAVGQVTLTATIETTSAQIQINILAAGSYPTGTAIWTMPPSTGYTALQLVQVFLRQAARLSIRPR